MIALRSGACPGCGERIVKVYLAVPPLLVAVFLAGSGIATLTRGWMLPLNRRYVRRPRLHGWAQLVSAFALVWQAVFGLLVGEFGFRMGLVMIGNVFLLVGFGLMGLSQRAPRPARPVPS
ncbi:hypothetical protein GCM10020229_08850 [Kitasatospora albolonga]